MKYRYKGRGTVNANGYFWDGRKVDKSAKPDLSDPARVVDVPEDDTATLQKLKTHPSFERVDG